MSSDTLVPIANHSDQAIARLMEQYKEKENIEKLIRIYTDRIQEIEDALQPLYLDRMIDNAEGVQLDRFGEIVVLDREGRSDEVYRRFLKVKIGINISKGRPEEVISILLQLTEATLVHYQNLGGANVALSVNTDIPADEVNDVYTDMQNVVSAGVRINYISCFDPDEPFSFDGPGPFGAGFSSLAAPTTGGKFAFIHKNIVPFAFALSTTDQGSDNALGFGSILDPFAGGTFEGL